MAVFTSLKKGYDGQVPAATPGESSSNQATSIDEVFPFVYRVVDPETGCSITCSLLLDKNDAISLENLLKKNLAQRDERCETLRHGKVILACTPGAMPLISFPERSLSLRLWRDEDYQDLLCMLAGYLHDPDADCPSGYERERD